MAKPFNPIGKPANSWLNSEGKYVPFEKMSDEHIQLAHTHAVNKEREYNAKSSLFNKLQEGLEEEAEKRGIEIIPRNSFAKKNMSYRKKKKLRIEQKRST